MDLHGSDLVDFGKVETDVAKFLQTVHPSGVFEIRSLDCPDRIGGTFRSTASGYFDDPLIAASEVQRIEKLSPPAINFTLCTVKPDLMARAKNRIANRAKAASNDTDAVSRRLLLIDVDADKMAGISSTDTEMRDALRRSIEIRRLLAESGWPMPIFGMSGNGSCLLYRVDLPADNATSALIQSLYVALHSRFGIKVDKSTHNASRLSKVLGTMARKGDELRGIDGVEDRIHRRSWYCMPDQFDCVDDSLIREIASTDVSVSVPSSVPSDSRALAEIPSDESAYHESAWSGGNFGESSFDLQQWIDRHSLPVRGPVPWQGGNKWVFTELPVLCQGSPSGHTDVSAAIFQLPNGAISAKCLHDRCTWKWEDLRSHYEPIKESRATIPIRDDLFVKNAPEITKQDQKAAEAKSRAEYTRKNVKDLVAFLSTWAVERVIGDEHVFRLSGPFFENSASSVQYLEVDADTLDSFRAMNKALTKWQTCKSCRIPVQFEKGWAVGVDFLLSRAINVEGSGETRISSLVAEKILMFIERCNRSLEDYANPDQRRNLNIDLGFEGVIYRDVFGVRQYLVDFTRLYESIRMFNHDVTRRDVSKTLDQAKSRISKINSINKKLRILNQDSIAILRQLTLTGSDGEIESPALELTAPPRWNAYESTQEDYGDDSFDFGMTN